MDFTDDTDKAVPIRVIRVLRGFIQGGGAGIGLLSNGTVIALICSLAEWQWQRYYCRVIIIRFSDEDSKRRALGCLPGRYPGTTWASGEMMVPDEALGFLAREGVRFMVEGPATYEQIASLRNPAAAEV